jgi:hypothetical protein
MPASSKPHIPFQPNPFGSAAIGSPWAGELADVPSINQKPFRTILNALGQMRAGAKGTSVFLIGDPGSGKTHLLGRLRNHLRQEQQSGKGTAIYVYLRCNASAGTLWRHLRHALASDLLNGAEGSQLHTIFRSDPSRLNKVTHEGLRHVLEHLREGQHFHAASAWLRGESLGDADLVALGLAVEKEDEDRSREREARLVVDALLAFLAPTPVVLCFDQIEALETYRGDGAGYHTMGQLISVLDFGHEHLLLISCIVSEREVNIERFVDQSDRDRWLPHKDVLRPIDWDQAVLLIKARLDAAPMLRNLRPAHKTDPLWPLDQSLLKPLFSDESGLCLPRKLIRACEQQFRELMGDEESRPQRNCEDFLQEEFDARRSEARKIVRRQGLSKTLSDCLPWLLHNSECEPLGQEESRSRYANQGWRMAGKDTALVFCDGAGIALTNQLKRIERSWTSNAMALAILRDVSVQPGAVGARTLTNLKQQGAREVHPLPEALAALQAIRTMVDTARSNELFNGDEQVNEETVTGWALANLPLQVEELRDALLGSQSEPEDPILSRLSALIRERKIIAADAAATELDLSPEQVKDCALHFPMRFGILDGPPVVIFEAIETQPR